MCFLKKKYLKNDYFLLLKRFTNIIGLLLSISTLETSIFVIFLLLMTQIHNVIKISYLL